jgi:Acyl-CoA reductase (LuxC)
LNTEDRIVGLIKLGQYLMSLDTEEINDMCQLAFNENRWFEPNNIKEALQGIRDEFLNETALRQWAGQYNIGTTQYKVGLVLAGNIPAVGWHDIQCSFVAGHKALIKYSEKDKVIIPFLINALNRLAPGSINYFEVVERLKDFDAVIATGSDNTARYFESYFAKYPHIIRKNRNAVGVMFGDESPETLHLLGKDIFTFFGLGCRNVSKIYVPQNYNFIPLLEALHEYNGLVHNNKYKNNFDYNIALFLLNKIAYQNNGSVIIREDERLTSRIASIHYEYYDDIDHLQDLLNQKRDLIQCIVSNRPIEGFDVFDMGKAQLPRLSDYADGVDTMALLTSIHL